MKALEKAAAAVRDCGEGDLSPLAYVDPFKAARAVISSIEVDDAADVVMLVALARHGIEPDIQQLLTSGDPMRGIRPGALRASLKAFLHSILVDGEGR